jgi:hypothetical protein
MNHNIIIFFNDSNLDEEKVNRNLIFIIVAESFVFDFSIETNYYLLRNI